MAETDPAPAAPPRLRLRVTPAAEAAVRRGHPWLYSESIREQNRRGDAGELAVVYDRHNRFLGIGLFDPDSPIRVRLLHTGRPQPLDNDWWRERLRQAVEKRRAWFDGRTTGFRCCNGESDGWPGLVLDRYASSLVLKLYTAAWLPRLRQIVALIRDELPCERIVLRLSRNLQTRGRPDAAGTNEHEEEWSDGQVLFGEIPAGPVTFLEGGIRFEAEVLKGQKTGFFLDQRDNRSEVERLAAGRAVLNAFSFSGGFSLYAARGGAVSVTDVDISSHALESAARNFALNREHPSIRACAHRPIQADIFEWLRESPPQQFGLAVLDPPSLARRESQRGDALRAYARLARSGIEQLRRGGVLVAASCSAHVSADEFFGAVRETARRAGRPFRELRTTRHPVDHPASIPEAEYLKCIYLRFD